MKSILKYFLALLAGVLITFASIPDASTATISTLSAIPKHRASNGFLLIRHVSLSDGLFLSGQLLPGATSFSAEASGTSGIVFAEWLDVGEGMMLEGKSKMTAPELSLRKSLKIQLGAVSSSAGIVSGTEAGSKESNLDLPVPTSMNIGNSPSGVSVSGPGTWPGLGRGLVDMVMSDLMSSSCWGKKGGFNVVEEVHLQDIINEINICKSAYFDQTTCPHQNFTTANMHVSGSLTSDGQNFQIDMNVTDSQGNVKSTASGSGSDFFSLEQQIASKLGKDLCKGSIEVTEAACLLTPTPLCTGGAYITAQFKGTAHGPVGSIIRTNLGQNIGATFSCGGWREYPCLTNLQCCSRDNEGQPEEIDFVARVNLPFPITYPGGTYQSPWCPVMQPITIQFIGQSVNEAIEIDRMLTCP